MKSADRLSALKMQKIADTSCIGDFVNRLDPAEKGEDQKYYHYDPNG